jgi:hypothetical protein
MIPQLELQSNLLEFIRQQKPQISWTDICGKFDKPKVQIAIALFNLTVDGQIESKVADNNIYYKVNDNQREDS